MPFQPPSYDSIRDAILRDIRSLLPDADIGSDSDNFVRSAAVAASIEGLYQHQAWIYRQIFPDTADEAELLRQAAIRGIRQRAPVAATGVVTLKGADDVVLNAGSTLKHVATGALFTTLEVGTIKGATALVSIVAQNSGAGSNGLTGAVVLTSPPLGVDAMATISTPLTGGSDVESVGSVLIRLLDLLRHPAAGGAAYDYQRWALEVEGVASATVLPRRRGPGTVDVVVTSNDGAASSEVIASCLAHIQSLCSVIADVWVYSPTIRVVNAITAVELVDGFSMQEVQAAAQKAYMQLVQSLKPNEPLKRSQVEAMINNLAGVVDRTLVEPASNINASDDPARIGWIRPGTITVRLME